MGDTPSNGDTATRRTPTPVGAFDGDFDALKQRTRTGFWQSQIRDVLSKSPGKAFVYTDVSSSAASNLRREHGLDAYPHEVNGEPALVVRYLPDQVDRIKQETRERGEKRKATMAKNKASKAAKAGKAPANA